jgi:hypothetical protein
MTKNPAGDLVRKASSALATVYACPFCNHVLRNPKGRAGQGMGRGHGLRTGGALFSKMAAHIRAEHPAEYANAVEVMDRPREFPFSREAERSDAMSEARSLTRDLYNATKRPWTFRYAATPVTSYVVEEGRR